MDAALSNLWSSSTYRLLAEGIPYRDISDVKARTNEFKDWCRCWSELGQEAERLGDAALERGFITTAAEEFRRASLAYFFGQFLFWHDPETKQIAYFECVRTFRRAVALIDPPIIPVDIPFRGITMPGFLRLPRGATEPPCVLLLDGLDTTKEEHFALSSICAQRGLAVLTFDGPGQGETFYKLKMSPGYEDAVRAAMDFAEKSPHVDGSRLGVIGRSLGSHYAPKVAAVDKRVKAVVSWGAMFDLLNYQSISPQILAGFLYVTGSKSLEEAQPYIESINLRGHSGEITCPMMVVHGGRDRITPPGHAELMTGEGRGPVELLYWEDSIHCAHDRSHLCRPAMADFMRKHLGVSTSA